MPGSEEREEGSRGSQGQSGSNKGEGRGSNLTTEDRSEGGRNSGGNFKNDPERASEAGRK
jgi:general stress protein YciG